jgi:hypothetical protein
MALPVKRAIVRVLLGVLVHASAASAFDVELDDCLAISTRVCADSPRVLVGSECGPTFYRFNGRIAWPPLKNIGPVTIAIQTRAHPMSTVMPLYLEIQSLSSIDDSTACRAGLGGVLLFAEPGSLDCEGIWTTVGPFDLQGFGVSQGEFYRVQVVFFETVPFPTGQIGHSPGMSCIRVTLQLSAVVPSTWTRTKLLYR